MIISIVIPTYNHGAKLAQTLDHLLASDAAGLGEVEIIVVDDGSPVPAAPVVESRRGEGPFALQCLRQENAGPAAARNHGFRASRGEIVLFVDDDILCPPELIRQHVDAHRRFPSSVIFGRCPLVQPPGSSPLIRYLEALNNDPGRDAAEDFLDTPLIASGNISFERGMFDREEGIYRDDLATPAAEEYELSGRLRERGIRILLAARIVALHNHQVDIRGICRQAYKHGKGCAEAALKSSAAADLPALGRIIAANRPARPGEPAPLVLKKAVKRVLSADPLRGGLILLVRALEQIVRSAGVLGPLYRVVIGLSFFAGVRAGLDQYAVAYPPARTPLGYRKVI